MAKHCAVSKKSCIFASRFRSSMDRMQDSGSCDEGSNPFGTTAVRGVFGLESPLFYTLSIPVPYFIPILSSVLPLPLPFYSFSPPSSIISFPYLTFFLPLSHRFSALLLFICLLFLFLPPCYPSVYVAAALQLKSADFRHTPSGSPQAGTIYGIVRARRHDFQ